MNQINQQPTRWYESPGLRAGYSNHLLRAMTQRFKPLSLAQFANRATMALLTTKH